MRINGTRQGTLRTNLPGVAEYQSFNPSPLQDVIPLVPTDEVVAALTTCARKVGEVEGMSRFLTNADMYLTMYVRKEALLSSQIEGTQCTFDDVLDPSNGAAFSQDIADVVNYVSAAELAIREMSHMPLCTRLLRAVHAKLLAGVRGSDKEPGEVRVSQNWIGPAGCTIQDASFVPPNLEDMHFALAKLEQFMNAGGIDPFIKAALVHYQFETIHPFLDGNGRLGRLLITLSLINDGVLSGPILYPSYQLKARRGEYYERLTRVREEGDYEGWVAFFCECLSASAEDAARSLRELVELHARSEGLIRQHLTRGANNGMALLEYLEAHPIASIAMVRDALSISRTAAANLIEEFRRMGILSEVDGSRQRYRLFSYEPYLAILRSGGDPL